MIGGRPIAFDVTHLVSRLNRRATTGIDRVDLGYAQHFAGNHRIDCGMHYGWRSPHVLTPLKVQALVQGFVRKVGDEERPRKDPVWEALRAWLLGRDAPNSDLASEMASDPVRRANEGAGAFLRQCAWRVAHSPLRPVPERAIYLNVAQTSFEHHRFFAWLESRPDVMPVFLLHDLLPLDHPEFFRHGYEERFRRRVETIVRRARAIVTTSEGVRQRLIEEYARRKIQLPPLIVQHLPSPLGERVDGDESAALAASPYFVLVATIEPRKNHMMILNVWRELGADAPRLVLVGANGWDNASTLSMLEKSPMLRARVRHVSGLSRASMRQLIVNARAVLMPSFAEGYGLPVVEALTLRTPPICSDIAIFREIAGDAATFISPLDGLGWKSAIEEFARPESPARSQALERARSFCPPDHADYFSRIESFLRAL
jgi:glycosyltransferase involved in cell wall biosynthesis